MSEQIKILIRKKNDERRPIKEKEKYRINI
jgi:hypothetical protein